VFHYQMSADVLVSYYPSELALNPYRSPGKLFEYMASRRPIVTADYASVREVLRPDSALFVEPDDADALADAIRRVLNDDDLAARLADGAYEDVRGYTWDARAERVHSFALEILGRSEGCRSTSVPANDGPSQSEVRPMREEASSRWGSSR
jgi:glycosyltransferase involved in cell wall biosynthesis